MKWQFNAQAAPLHGLNALYAQAHSGQSIAQMQGLMNAAPAYIAQMVGLSNMLRTPQQSRLERARQIAADVRQRHAEMQVQRRTRKESE